MEHPPSLVRVFVDDGQPEARDYESNYAVIGPEPDFRTRALARPGLASLVAWLRSWRSAPARSVAVHRCAD